jgi:hypothetical protein
MSDLARHPAEPQSAASSAQDLALLSLVSEEAARSGAAAPSDVRPGRWQRLLQPSFSDFFFAAMMVWLFLLGDGWQSLLMDGDVGWHIRAGEYVLDHRAVPDQDLFSFSKPGAPWFAWEWLADVIDAGLFRIFGLKGVVLLAGVLAVLFAWLLLRHVIWKRANAFIALVVTLAAVNAATIHFHARPHIWTLALLAGTFWILDADRRNPGPRVLLLVPLTAVWTNLHGGFLAGIAAIGLTAVGEAAAAVHQGHWGAWKHPRWRPALRYGALAAGCAAASLVNPYGWGLHKHIFEYLRSDWIKNAIQEFQSPVFRGENMANFEVLLMAGLVTAGFAARRGDWTAAFRLLFFAHQALASSRHVTLYVIAATPLLASEASAWWQAVVLRCSRNSVPAILDQMAASAARSFAWSSVWPGVLVLTLAALGEPVRWPREFPKQIFPVGIVQKHKAALAEARVLTFDQWADYLIFTSYPRQRVFFDGRSDFYGPELGGKYVAMTQGEHNWEKLMAEQRFDAVLAPVNWPLVSLLKLKPEWRVAEDDGHAVLFFRTAPNTAEAPSRLIAPPSVRGTALIGAAPPGVPKGYRDEKIRFSSLMKTTHTAEIETGDHE